MQNQRYISYLRVSTEKQGKSQLGLESQQQIIRNFIEKNGGELIDEIIEVESGKRNNRPQLKKALDACRKNSALLLLPKLDRLSRRVSFVSHLMESKIHFTICDMPHASDFQIHIYSALAQEERRLIAERTKNALAAAKVRGVELGKNGKILAAQNKLLAAEFRGKIQPTIIQLRQEGFITLQKMCDELNRRNISTFRGGQTKWHLPQVAKILKSLAI